MRGTDSIHGGLGSDSCLATFDNHGGDTIVGGPGTDIWYADPGDHASTVEKKIICFAD
jgi:hypothetical protein